TRYATHPNLALARDNFGSDRDHCSIKSAEDAQRQALTTSRAAATVATPAAQPPGWCPPHAPDKSTRCQSVQKAVLKHQRIVAESPLATASFPLHRGTSCHR